MSTRRDTTGKRAGIYERVSSEEQVEGYSLDAQDRAGRAYCEAQGWTAARVYRDEGRSARTDDLAKRPVFAEMLADAEAGLIDVVVVHKLDRFARNLRVTLETLDRLKRCDVGFVSINEQMDFASPIGKVVLATLAAFAQYYSDNLSWETKKGKTERKRQGLYNGLLPFGVKKNDDGIPVPDPESYPGLLLAFRLSSEGRSDRDVAEALNAAGYRTTGNRGRNPFTKDTVARMLQNRFYLGELPDGAGAWLPGRHSPVLDSALFERAQATRLANRNAPLHAARTRRRHSLSGLGVCGHCGGRLHVATYAKGETRVYCYQRTQTDRCPQRSNLLPDIEEQIAAHLRTFHLPEETVEAVIRVYAEAGDRASHAETRKREIEGRLERIRELYAWGDLRRDAYAAERDRLEAERASLAIGADFSAVLARAAAFLRDLPAAWAAATPEERNDLARLVFEAVEITDGRVTAFRVHEEFAPFFRATFGGAAGNDDTADGNGSPNGGVKRELDEAEATGIACAR